MVVGWGLSVQSHTIQTQCWSWAALGKVMAWEPIKAHLEFHGERKATSKLIIASLALGKSCRTMPCIAREEKRWWANCLTRKSVNRGWGFSMRTPEHLQRKPRPYQHAPWCPFSEENSCPLAGKNELLPLDLLLFSMPQFTTWGNHLSIFLFLKKIQHTPVAGTQRCYCSIGECPVSLGSFLV